MLTKTGKFYVTKNEHININGKRAIIDQQRNQLYSADGVIILRDMKLKDARTINAAELYDRRKQAVMLYKKGMTRREIAPIVGVTPYTVGQWLKAWQKGGHAGLKARAGGRPKGSGRKLLPHEEKHIQRCITDHCPDQLKLAFVLWSRKAVQALIKQEFELEITLQGLSKYLKKWNFTPQKPIRRAYQRDEVRVTKIQFFLKNRLKTGGLYGYTAYPILTRIKCTFPTPA